MDTCPEPGDFESQDNQEGEGFENPVEEIDVWEPIKAEIDNSDIQSPGIQTTSDMTHHEEVDVWKRVSTEKMRQTLAHRFMRLLEAWVVIGLIIFVITGNVWLLTTAGLLGLPLQKILDYYFRRPKK
jgi:hypothetical protein